jgi:Na+/melibiose symporter-like transporter
VHTSVTREVTWTPHACDRITEVREFANILSFTCLGFLLGWLIDGMHSRKRRSAQKATLLAFGVVVLASLSCLAQDTSAVSVNTMLLA